jgi:tRNA G18 (ribose-2'-O)-methylase SpoU
MKKTDIRLHIVLDNVRSAFNVGSIFRSADAVGGAKLYLCGMTATPENIKIHKTALGAEEFVPWKHYKTTLEAVKEIKATGIPVYSVELAPNNEHFQKIKYPSPLALVFGHERNGVSQLVLDLSDKIIFIPMGGVKESLNVANSASIIMFEAIRPATRSTPHFIKNS